MPTNVYRGSDVPVLAGRYVYGDYASHAEESLEHDRVPPGYRTYVERYFDLIRPRTDAPPPSSP